MGTFKRAAAIVMLGAFGAVGLGSAAAADSSDVTTPGWYWEAVDDAAFTIGEAHSSYPDFMGSGVDLTYGWSSVFNHFFDGNSGSLTVAYNGGPAQDLVFSSVSADYVDGGLSTLVGTDSVAFGGGNTFDVTLTLSIQGSYARWVFAYVSTGTGDVTLLQTHAAGKITNDGDADYTFVGTNALVVPDGFPVIGTYFTSPGAWAYDVTDGDSNLAVDFAGPAGTLVLSLIDHDPCSWDVAIAAMTALVPTLPATFGADNAIRLSPTCLAISAPAQIGIGSVTDQHLTLTASSPLDSLWDLYSGDAPDWYRAVPLDLPAGLALATEYDPGTGEPSLHLTGTAPAGTYVVHVLSYYDAGGGDNWYPGVSTFTVEVVLAATGSESASLLWPALALVGLGAGLLVVARRVRPRER